MSDKNLQQRAQIDAEAMYPEEAQWEKDLTEAVKTAEAFTRYSGHLTDSADTLYEALTEKDAIWRKLEHAFVYAAMRKDEDNRVSKYQSMDDKCGSAIAKISALRNLNFSSNSMTIFFTTSLCPYHIGKKAVCLSLFLDLYTKRG